jgi:hypothetical protein
MLALNLCSNTRTFMSKPEVHNGQVLFTWLFIFPTDIIINVFCSESRIQGTLPRKRPFTFILIVHSLTAPRPFPTSFTLWQFSHEAR